MIFNVSSQIGSTGTGRLYGNFHNWKTDGALPTISVLSSNSTTASVNHDTQSPFPPIKALVNHLHAHLDDAQKLNATYPYRGVVKTAALHKTQSDLRFAIDLSPKRNSQIPDTLCEFPAAHGLNEVLNFFDTLAA